MKASKTSSRSGETSKQVNQLVFADSNAGGSSLNLVQMLRRQTWLVLASVSLGIALAALYWMHAPIWYESSARVLVNERNASVSSTASGTESIINEDILANHMEILRSRRIVETALVRHGLQNLPSLKAVVGPENDAADFVINNLRLSRGGDGGAKDARSLAIKFQHTNPDDARLVLEAIVVEYQMFLGEQLADHMSQATDMIEEAQSNLEEELREAQDDWVGLRQKAPMLFRGEGTSNVYQEEYARLHEEVETLNIQKATMLGRLKEAQEKLAEVEAMENPDAVGVDVLSIIDADSMQRLGLFASLQVNTARTAEFLIDQPTRTAAARFEMTELLMLKAEEGRLRENFGDGHPDVREIRGKIAFMENYLRENGPGNAGWDDESMNPRSLLNTYVGILEADLRSIAQRTIELETMKGAASEQGRTLIAVEMEDAILRSRVERTQALFDGLVDQLRQLDMASGMHGYIHELLETPRRGERVWPSLKICGVGGLMLGLVGGLFLGIFNDRIDQRFRSSDEIDEAIDLPILGRVGRLKQGATRGVARLVADDLSVESEVFRLVRAILLADVKSGKLKVISGTSPVPRDGKSTILANVAASFAKLNMSVLVIDADMRRPTSHKMFGVPLEDGLADVLQGRLDLDAAIKTSQVDNLSVMTAGLAPDNPSELLQLSVFDEILEQLRERFQLVVVDAGPVLAVADPIIVSQKVDGTLLVVRSANDTREQVVDAVARLRTAGANLLGCLVNMFGSNKGFEQGGYYGYYGDYNKSPSASQPPANGKAAAGADGGQKDGPLRIAAASKARRK